MNTYDKSKWHVYQYGRYIDFISIEREKDTIILKNIASGERISGKNKILNYLKNKNMEVK